MRSRGWSLKARLVATTLAAILITLALGVQLLVRYRQAAEASAAVLDTLAPASQESAFLDRSIDAMDRSLRAYTATSAPEQLEAHMATRVSVAGSLERLAGLLAGREPLPELVADIATAQDQWLAGVSDPALAAMDSGDQAAAQAIMAAPESDSLLVALGAASLRLAQTLALEQREATAQAADQTRALARAMAVGLLVLLLLPVAGWLVLRRSVLTPVRRLRTQLRTAADPLQRHRRIAPGGPTELNDLAVDAEGLRRALVEQIDLERAARAGLEQQVPVVAAIRQELAPPPDDESGPLWVAGFMRPAQGVLAGDFWDRFTLPSGATTIVLCDVAGHGPRAGIVAMRLRTTIRIGLMAGDDPADVLAGACEDLSDDASTFATLILLILAPDGGLTWVNAGHPAARVLRGDGRLELLEPTGPFVSWLGGQWKESHRRMAPGDIVLAFSDGLLESRDASGEELGETGLDGLLISGGKRSGGQVSGGQGSGAQGSSRPSSGRAGSSRAGSGRLGDGSPVGLIDWLVASVRERAEVERLDDLTLVAVSLAPQATVPARRRRSGERHHPEPA